MEVNTEPTGELLFEPYPFEERRGEWGSWQVDCEICGAHHIPARFCRQCREYECWRCDCDQSPHRRWLHECARLYFQSRASATN